jgi:endoglucanase
MDRRSFVKTTALLCAAGHLGVDTVFASEAAGVVDKARAAVEDITAARIPRRRGFNLQGKFSTPQRPYDGPAYEEFDFTTMSEWGFDFARLPLWYWAWGNRDDWSVIREEPLKKIDQAIDLGRQHGIHINLNFHRIPGYCINGREQEPADLFSGTKAQRDKALGAGVYHWEAFARRYKGIPNWRLSFDLINEPPKMRSYEGYLEERYVEIVKALVAGIREEDPNRLIFVDGMNIGQAPVLGIVDLGLVQSTRGYLPLALWKEAGWGFSLWELRGSFGVIDSERADVPYEDFKGHKLDRKMLELLRSY